MIPDRRELARFALLQGFHDTELASLARIMERKTLDAHTWIFREQDSSDEIYLLRSGKVEILAGTAGKREHVLTVLPEGSALGELAFLDGSPRSASARAVEATELLVLHRHQLDQLPDSARLLNRLALNIGRSSAVRLKRSTAQHVASLEAQLDTMRMQHDFGQFFIYTLASFAISTIINALLHSHLRDVDIYARTFSWSYLLILLLPSLFIVRRLHMPFSQIGFNSEGWRKSVREGFLASGFSLVLFVVCLALSRHTSWVSFRAFDLAELSWVPSYMFHSALQEFLARGIVQTSFQRFFGDERGARSVFLASIVFSLFHVHFGLLAVAVTFVSSLFFGSFYLRHQNLLGVSLWHGTLGSCAFLLGIL